MGLLFYRLSIWSYFIGIRIASLTNKKAKKLIEGSGNSLHKINEDLKDHSNPVAWFHCASLGEYEQGRPLMEEYSKAYPKHTIVVTFFSPSGYENAIRITPYTYYLPTDTKVNASEFISSVNPVVAVFIRYEFWYFYMRELTDRKIPVISVSSDFRPNQIFFKKFGKFYLSVLKKLTHFFVQNDSSKKLLSKHGIEQVSITGDTRFDRVREIADSFQPIPEIRDFLKGAECMVIGSAWSSDMELIYPLITQLTEFKFIIAPHELSEKFYKEIETNIGTDVEYLSRINTENDCKVLIIDSIGILSRVYGHAKYAFVGGGMGPGVHSVLEPAAYGIPVFFGNRNYERWKESVNLVNAGGGFALGSSQELEEIIQQLENDPDQYEGHCINSEKYIEDHSGSTHRIITYLKPILS